MVKAPSPFLAGLLLIYNAALIAVFEFTGIEHGLLAYFILVLLLTSGSFLMIHFFRKAHISPMGNEAAEEDFNETLEENTHVSELKRLKDMERYRKDFLGNVSHELKTPIFNIQGYLLTLLDGGIDDPGINRLYLKRAEKSINRLNSIVEDLDSIARLDSGEFKLNPEIFNLMKVMEEVLDDHEMPARQRNIRINLDGPPGRAARVKADKRLIFEVIENLVSNSIKYGKEGGKTSISVSSKGNTLVVSVSDNGIGIAEKDIPRIFERFYRVDKSRSRESGGTGLGLSIVKHTLQAHKQNIYVRSRVGAGSTFTFSLEKA